MTDTFISDSDAFMAQLVRRRQRLRLTQQQVGELMGVSGTRVSAIERADLASMELGTLRRYVEALGGRLAVNVHVPRETSEGES